MILKINNPQQEPELIKAQATYYPDMVQVYIPKHPIKTNKGFDKKAKLTPFPGDKELEYIELSNKFDELTNQQIAKLESETDLDRSLRRAKKRIGDYILCNDFELFATFTMNSLHGDREDSELSRNKLMGWLKNQRNRNGKFRYIVVPEFHGDKKALRNDGFL